MNLGCVTGVSPIDLAAVYLKGWVPATLVAYGSAYQDIVRYGTVLGKHWYHWREKGRSFLIFDQWIKTFAKFN